MNTLKVSELESALQRSWIPRLDAEVNELVHAKEISLGQCAITALVVQDYFGGEILNTFATDPRYPDLSTSHYFNMTDEGVIDFTRSQFKDGVQFSEAIIKRGNFASARSYILSYESTVERYEALKPRVEQALSDKIG